MLKIEVIKFEAMDVITASVAAPEEDKPAECICSNETWYHHEGYNNGVANHNFGDVKCNADSHPNCWQPTEVN